MIKWCNALSAFKEFRALLKCALAEHLENSSTTLMVIFSSLAQYVTAIAKAQQPILRYAHLVSTCKVRA